ncbi:MAG: helix-turn-helix transcriptional regulator [Lachnospiraceae bacterium]|nr:helix-turn-helix transcriptional regulator [Lachnospiraceae bacterium]
MIKLLLSARLGERRLTQADLARMTGIRSNTINELYHEIAERVSLEHLDLICEALECDLEDLIVREPNKKPKIVHTRTGIFKSDDIR